MYEDENSIGRFIAEINEILYDWFKRPKTCSEFAQRVALYFDDLTIKTDWEPNDSDIEQIYSYIQGKLSEYYPDCSMSNFLKYLSTWSKGLPLARKLYKLLLELFTAKHAQVAVGKIVNRFELSKTFAKYKGRGTTIETIRIPLHPPKTSGKKFSEFIGLNFEVTKKIFGFDKDYELYEHQLKAVLELSNPDTSIVVVSTPNASGKTEIGLIHIMKILEKRIDNILVLAVYPTKALARDQLERWKERLRKFFEYKFGGNVASGKFCLQTDAFTLVLLDGDTIKRKEVQDCVANARYSTKTFIVLTNPQFLLSATRSQKAWYRHFGHRCLYFLVLDEIHFYRAYDLTLLITTLNHIIQFFGCRENSKCLTKVLVLSATMGDPKKFINHLMNAWALKGEYRCVTTDIDGKRTIGFKQVYIIRVSDDRIAEGLIKDYIEEIIRNAVEPEEIEKTLIFVPNRNIADRLWKELQSIARRKFAEDIGYLEALSIVDRHLGDMALWERERIEKNFKEGKTRILITVKTLEIGIDIGDVTRIIHLGLPSSLNDFIQREGRAGRRPGEYESLIIVTTPREERLARSFVESLKSGKFYEYTYTPIINTEAYLIKRINKHIVTKGTIPRRIKIPIPQEGITIDFLVSFYTQDKKLFNLIDLSRKRRVRVIRAYDVIFRYLPGMIRPITKSYIVANIDKNKREIQLDELTQAKFEEIWRENSQGSLRLDLVSKGMLFTISDVDTEFKAYKHRTLYGRDLDLIEVYMKPLGVKLIRKEYRRVLVNEKGKIVEIRIPVFIPLGYKPVDEDLSEQLKMRIITRGIHIRKLISELEPLYDIFIDKLKHYAETLNQGLSKYMPGLNIKEKIESLRISSEYLLLEYTHLAIHLLLNIVYKLENLRPDDVEHYVAARFDKEQLIRDFIESLIMGKPFTGEIPITIEIVLASEADIVGKVRWEKVSNELSSIMKALSEAPDTSLLREIIAELYLPRCFNTPAHIEGLLEGDRNLEQVIRELRSIAELSKLIADEVVKYFMGVDRDSRA